jgi:hypothetical protein
MNLGRWKFDDGHQSASPPYLPASSAQSGNEEGLDGRDGSDSASVNEGDATRADNISLSSSLAAQGRRSGNPAAEAGLSYVENLVGPGLGAAPPDQQNGGGLESGGAGDDAAGVGSAHSDVYMESGAADWGMERSLPCHDSAVADCDVDMESPGLGAAPPDQQNGGGLESGGAGDDAAGVGSAHYDVDMESGAADWGMKRSLTCHASAMADWGVAPVDAFCFLCARRCDSRFMCPGQDGVDCEIRAAFCSDCQGNGTFRGCSIVCSQQGSGRGETDRCQRCRDS